jgi:hypothetical protein
MFDQKQYIAEKIFKKINSILDDSMEKSVKTIINSMNNLSLMNVYGNSFEDSAIGWIKFCDIIQYLISNNELLTIEAVKFQYELKIKEYDYSNAKSIKKKEDLIDEKLLNKDAPDVNYLLSIAETYDCANDFTDDELTEQGLREMKLIGKDETTLDGEELTVVKAMPDIVVYEGDTIFSPYTGSDFIAQINSDTFVDLNNDKEFKVRILRK